MMGGTGEASVSSRDRARVPRAVLDALVAQTAEG